MQRKPGHFAIGLLVASALGAPPAFAADRRQGNYTGTRIPLAAGPVSIRSMPR